MSILSVVTLRQAGVTGGDAASLVPAGQALVAVRDWTQVIGPGMAGINALLLGSLMYRSRLVPRAIPALGLIGAPVFLSAVIGIIFGINEPGTAWHAIGVIPMFFWELALGLWMTFKGFKRSGPLMTEAAAETGSADGSATAVPSPTSVAAKAGAA